MKNITLDSFINDSSTQKKNKIYSVSQLNEYIQDKFQSDPKLKSVELRGELSNFKRWSSGHLYFSLKDEDSKIDGVMFKYQAINLNFRPEDGMEVLVKGHVDIYPQRGEYKFYVQSMTQYGLGDLYIKYEELKNKLRAEGLFQIPKKLIPSFPKKIAVVTSSTGAVIKDIITTINRRWPYIDIILYNTIVQGKLAEKSISKNLLLADSSDADIIIVGRGGGSFEDLFSFSQESVVRAIANCKKPVISAVGHESDHSLADLVADVRAPTPTAAAEIAVPSKDEIKNRLNHNRNRLNQSINKTISEFTNRLIAIKEKQILKDPMRFYENKIEKIGFIEEKLNTIMINRIESNNNQVNRLKDNLNRLCNQKLQDIEFKLNNISEKLIILNPIQTIKRGYSIVKKDNNLISSIKKVNIGDKIAIELKDGAINGTVENINENLK
ncbi:MAG: exodeoxyribonuclease VII large subunit [Methanobrevibacter sp.]|nr:exodeoxyribonuclease VII large subunit [Candidatus Methanoflexus mossambicus]